MKCMDMSHSDAIVFFGATGDLAYKQIFPALQALVKRHTLDIPIMGVAKARWTLDQLRVRARQSVAQHCGVDEGAFAKVSALLRLGDVTPIYEYAPNTWGPVEAESMMGRPEGFLC